LLTEKEDGRSFAVSHALHIGSNMVVEEGISQLRCARRQLTEIQLSDYSAKNM
jgi:hypothetical protein